MFVTAGEEYFHRPVEPPRDSVGESPGSGGRPVPLVKPILPSAEDLLPAIARALRSGRLSNGGPNVAALELALARLSNRAHAVATSSATTGLIVMLKALGWRGEVLVPSFTFAATAHAVVWAGLEPVLVDVDPNTYTIDPASAARMRGPRTSGVLAVNVFGVPPDVAALSRALPGLPIACDAAHGLGSERSGSELARASVVSLHATKTVVAGEGGVVLTDDAGLAARVRRAVNFGFDENRDCAEIGVNGKLTELSAILALAQVPTVAASLAGRRGWAEAYRRSFEGVDGISMQEVPPDAVSSHQFFGLRVDAERFGASRREVADALTAEGIDSRAYFSPAVHQLTCYRGRLRSDALPVTERLSSEVLCVPMHPGEPVSGATRIARCVQSVRRKVTVG